MSFKIVVGILTGIVVLLVGLLAYKIIPQSKSSTKSPSPTVALSPVAIDYIQLKNQVVKDDILIDKALLDKPSFIAIHRSVDGKPGDVIASSRLLSGEQKNIVIYIKTPPAVGEILYAMIHVDNGDGIHQSPGEDTFFLGENGQPYMKPFTVLAP